MDCSMPGSHVLHCLSVCSESCPLSPWCYLTISSSAAPFSFCLQSFPASGSFPVSWFFLSRGQSVGFATWCINLSALFFLFKNILTLPDHLHFCGVFENCILFLNSLAELSNKVAILCVCMLSHYSVMSDSLQPCGVQPTRLLCPWDSAGKNTGVGCYFLNFLKKLKDFVGFCLTLHWFCGSDRGELMS